MKRIVLLFAAVLLTLTFTQGTQAQQDPKAKGILDAMAAKYKQMAAMQANFSYTIKNTNQNLNVTHQGKIAIKGDMYKLTTPDQEVVNNGKTVWTYLAEVNEVNIDHFYPEENEITPSKIFSLYKEGYKYMYLESSTIGGKSHHVIDLVPEDRGTPIYRVRMYINASDNSLTGWTMYDRSNTEYKYTITDFKVSNSLADTFFTFNEADYDGVDVVDLRF